MKDLPNDNFLILCSNKHIAYGLGVTERIWAIDKAFRNDTFTVYSRETNYLLSVNRKAPTEYGFELI
jgi:hypothetical protein